MTPKKRNINITYKLTPEELKYFSWVSMSPELRKQNRNNRVKAYLLSAPSIGNFWEALLTYIGNRDPENPHLNTGEAPNASRVINPKLVVQVALTAGKIVDKAKRYITLTKESTKMLNYPRIGQRYSKSLDIMSDFNPISDLLHLRLPDFTHSSLGLGNKYRAIGGRKALKSVIENGVVAPKGLFSREGKVFWNDGYLNRTYSGRGIFALSYDKTGKAPFYPGGKPNNRYVYSLHENPIDFYDEALGLHARIPFTSTYVEIPKTLAGIDRALKLDKINRYVEKPIHKLYNWGLKPYLGYLGFKYFNSKEEEINKKEELEKLKKQQYLDDYYSYYYKDGGLIRKMQTAAGGALLPSKQDMKYQTAAANKLGEWFLKGLGTVGKILTAPFTSQGPTSATIYKSKELLAKERTIENKSEEQLGKAMTWASPLNYGAALATGNGLNAKKGGEEIEKLEPWQQALLRGTELYVGPKAVKGVGKGIKAGTKAAVNTAAKAGVKPAKAAVVAREIKLATKKGVLTLEQLQPKVRTRYGDVEIDNPQLAYRQGKGITEDFIKKGKVEAAPKPKEYLVPDKRGWTWDFTPQHFDAPMFSQGTPWFGPKGGGGGNMLVTAEPLSLGDFNGGLLSWKGNGTFDVRYKLDDLHGPVGRRRVPNEGQVLNMSNTTAYKWVPGYGYRKVTTEPMTSLKFFEKKPFNSKLKKSEEAGVPKGERNNRLHGQALAPYYDYSLINKHYEPWTVNEKGQFVFGAPEKAGKLGTLHFTFNEPVMSHMMGSWDDAPTVTLLPYRNVRSLAAPVDMAIMDTFFPNYKGLKISSRGAKTLTGDKKTFDYYKSKGLDVEFSPEMEGQLQQLQGIKAKLELLKNSGYDYFSPEMLELYKQQRAFKDKINSIGVEWSKKHVKPIPNYEKVNALGKAEGFDMEQYPYRLASPKKDAYGIPLEASDTELNYTWQSDPSNHFMVGEHPEVVLKSALNGEYGKVRPEFIKYLEWASKNKADYRKKGG